MEYIMNEVMKALECYNRNDKIGCAVHLQNGGYYATAMFLNCLKLEEVYCHEER